jgi:hypothetical protein
VYYTHAPPHPNIVGIVLTKLSKLTNGPNKARVFVPEKPFLHNVIFAGSLRLRFDGDK